MRTVTKESVVYKFEELSDDSKAAAINFLDPFSYNFEERMEVLFKLNNVILGKFDYKISYESERGEFISITEYNEDALEELLQNKTECPLSGCCYDINILEPLKNGISLEDALSRYLCDTHKEYLHVISDESMIDFCETNDYEFTIDGNLFTRGLK